MFSLKILLSKILFLVLVICIALSSMSCADSMNSDARKDNQRWLALLEKNEIKKVVLTGVKSAEEYNKISEVSISDNSILQRLSKLAKDKKIIYRDIKYMKGRTLTCDAILYDGSGEYYKLLLSKTIYNKGLIESFRSDSIYQDNKFVYFADSIFRARIN